MLFLYMTKYNCSLCTRVKYLSLESSFKKTGKYTVATAIELVVSNTL